MMVKRQPPIASHVRKKRDDAGKALFEDTNAWVSLTEIFVDVLRDSGLSTAYLIIDALDGYVIDLLRLVDNISRQSSRGT
jgi:hypothetical protein